MRRKVVNKRKLIELLEYCYPRGHEGGSPSQSRDFEATPLKNGDVGALLMPKGISNHEKRPASGPWESNSYGSN